MVDTPTTPGTNAGSKIIVFAGPKEGVGKTTIALNLALAWAGIQRRSVLIVPLDPLARSEHAQFLGLNPPSVADLVRTLGAQSLTIAGGLLKGKIPISQWGVGVLPLATRRTDIQKISPRVLLPMLSKLSQTFDIFLDVESSFPMQTFAFDISDMIVWVTEPSRANLNATVGMFQDYREMHFPLDRFEIICNRYDLPGSIEPEEIEKFFNQLNKKVLVFLPWEESIPFLANQNKLEVVEQPQSLWVKGLRMLLSRVMNSQPIDKNWTSAVSDEDFFQAASALWSVPKGMEGSSRAPSSQPQQTQDQQSAASSAPLAAVPAFWEDLKQQVHRDVVKTLEIEHVRISDNASANAEVRAKVSSIADQLLGKQPNLQLSREQRIRFVSELLDEILGLGPLEELMRD